MFRMHCIAAVLAWYVVLGSWKGYLAIFEKDAAEPRQIFPTRVETLPEERRQALEEGIIVRNERDLNRLLEVYRS